MTEGECVYRQHFYQQIYAERRRLGATYEEMRETIAYRYGMPVPGRQQRGLSMLAAWELVDFVCWLRLVPTPGWMIDD
jgi:hypothetical protein